MIRVEPSRLVQSAWPAVWLWVFLVLCLRMAMASTPAIPMPGPPPPFQHRLISVKLPRETRDSRITVTLEPLDLSPNLLAVVIDKDFSAVNWGPFTNSVAIDLGPGDGTHTVSLGYQWGPGDIEWSVHTVQVITDPPLVIITEPPTNFVSQPMIQLRGYSIEPLEELRYDIRNASGTTLLRNEQGFVNHVHFDTHRFRVTTNFFTCYDIDLTPGTNTVVLRCLDRAGNRFTTNLTFIFSTEGDTKAPSLGLIWPRNGAELCDSQFYVSAHTDDATAKIFAFITDETGNTHERQNEAGRYGDIQIEALPLAEGNNFITLIGSDAAGNSSLTNITVRRARGRLEMDKVLESELWNRQVTVTGFTDLTNYAVWVNGVQAVVDASGRWKAEKVPMTEGSSASFHLRAIPIHDQEPEAKEDMVPTPVITWGEITNGLRAGIGFLPVDTNRFNPYACKLYATNSLEAPMGGGWMRPRAAYRYRLRLFDPQGKQVPRSWSVDKKPPPPPEDLNIHRLTKKEIGFIEGLLAFPPGQPVCLDSLSLGYQFAFTTPGLYRLEVVERLFRIESDGRLKLVSLPPVSAEVQVIDQPTEIAFHLERLHENRRLWRGAPRDGLQVAITYEHKYRPKIADRLSVFLINQSTNAPNRLMLPKPEEQFEMVLYDAEGKEVPKTLIGKRHGRPPSVPLPRNRRQVRDLRMGGRDAIHCSVFDLHHHFRITRAGKYRLMYQQNLYRVGKQGELEVLKLPMVMVPIELFITPNEK